MTDITTVVQAWERFYNSPTTLLSRREGFSHRLKELHREQRSHELSTSDLQQLFISTRDLSRFTWWARSIGDVEARWRLKEVIYGFQEALTKNLDAHSFDILMTHLDDIERLALIDILVANFFEVSTTILLRHNNILTREPRISMVADYCWRISQDEQAYFIKAIFSKFRSSIKTGDDFCHCQQYLSGRDGLQFFINITNEHDDRFRLLTQDKDFVHKACRINREIFLFVLGSNGMALELDIPQRQKILTLIAHPCHGNYENEFMVPFRNICHEFRSCLPQPRFKRFSVFRAELEQNRARYLDQPSDPTSGDQLWLEAYHLFGKKSEDPQSHYQQPHKTGLFPWSSVSDQSKSQIYEEELRRNKLGKHFDQHTRCVRWLR